MDHDRAAWSSSQVSTDPYAHVTALNMKRWKSWDISSPSFMWMAT